MCTNFHITEINATYPANHSADIQQQNKEDVGDWCVESQDLHDSSQKNNSNNTIIARAKNDIDLNNEMKLEMCEDVSDIDIKQDVNHCEKCLCSFQYKSEYLEHVQVIHGLEKIQKHHKKCLPNSSKETIKQGVLKPAIMEILTVVKKNDFSEILPNLKREETMQKKDYTCIICLKKYSYKTLVSHLNEVHCAKRAPCIICKKTFKCIKYLRRHIRSVHKGAGIEKRQNKERKKNISDIQVVDDDCHSKVIEADDLKSVNGKVKKEYHCEICFKEYDTQEQVGIHVRNAHKDLKICWLCNKLSNLKYHVCGARKV